MSIADNFRRVLMRERRAVAIAWERARAIIVSSAWAKASVRRGALCAHLVDAVCDQGLGLLLGADDGRGSRRLRAERPVKPANTQITAANATERRMWGTWLTWWASQARLNRYRKRVRPPSRQFVKGKQKGPEMCVRPFRTFLDTSLASAAKPLRRGDVLRTSEVHVAHAAAAMTMTATGRRRLLRRTIGNHRFGRDQEWPRPMPHPAARCALPSSDRRYRLPRGRHISRPVHRSRTSPTSARGACRRRWRLPRPSSRRSGATASDRFPDDSRCRRSGLHCLR